MNQPVLLIQRVGMHNLPLPSRAHPGDSGLDLRANIPEGLVLAQGCHVRIPTGFAIQIPRGYEGQIRPRSSSRDRGHEISFGTIDQGYRGELLVGLAALDFVSRVSPGQRIAQLVIAPVALPGVQEVDELEPSERGTGRFGHTGEF